MENKIAIASLAGALSKTTGKTKKQCEDFLKEFFKIISESLEKGESVKVKGFGTFKVTEVESRTSVNVTTGEPTEISAYKKVVFTPSKELSATINTPFADFETVEMDDEMPEELFMPEAAGAKENEVENASGTESQSNESPDQVEEDENEVSNNRLIQGSEEEGDDDTITAEAYNTLENSRQEEKAEEEASMVETSGEEENAEEKPEEGNVLAASNIDALTEVEVPSSELEEPKKSRFGMGFFIGVITTLLICVVIFALGCFFNWWPYNFGIFNNNNKEMPQKEVVVTAPTEEARTNEAQEIPAVADAGSVPVTDTISHTRYLTTMAREHYNNYNFWPYIYIENSKILGHPDRITPGTVVVVPPLSKYGVSADKEEDIVKAKQLSKEIYSKYK